MIWDEHERTGTASAAAGNIYVSCLVFFFFFLLNFVVDILRSASQRYMWMWFILVIFYLKHQYWYCPVINSHWKSVREGKVSSLIESSVCRRTTHDIMVQPLLTNTDVEVVVSKLMRNSGRPKGSDSHSLSTTEAHYRSPPTRQVGPSPHRGRSNPNIPKKMCIYLYLYIILKVVLIFTKNDDLII